MTDFNDDQLAAESAREKELLQQRDIEDIRFVMGSEQGRRVIWGYWSRARCFLPALPVIRK